MPHLFSTSHQIECASEEANCVLAKALEFATTVKKIQIPGQPYEYYTPNRDMLVAQHVKIQLSCLQAHAYTTDSYESLGVAVSRMSQGLAELAETCKEDGVKVKVAQPWHRAA